jgi:hypothetical protein
MQLVFFRWTVEHAGVASVCPSKRPLHTVHLDTTMEHSTHTHAVGHPVETGDPFRLALRMWYSVLSLQDNSKHYYCRTHQIIDVQVDDVAGHPLGNLCGQSAHQLIE